MQITQGQTLEGTKANARVALHTTHTHIHAQAGRHVPCISRYTRAQAHTSKITSVLNRQNIDAQKSCKPPQCTEFSPVTELLSSSRGKQYLTHLGSPQAPV